MIFGTLPKVSQCAYVYSVTCHDSPCFILSSAVSEEGVHHVRLVAEDGHDVGNGLDPGSKILTFIPTISSFSFVLGSIL